MTLFPYLGKSKANSVKDYGYKSHSSKLIILNKGNVKDRESQISEISQKHRKRMVSLDFDHSYLNGLDLEHFDPNFNSTRVVMQGPHLQIPVCHSYQGNKIAGNNSIKGRRSRLNYIRKNLNPKNSSSSILASMSMLKSVYEDNED